METAATDRRAGVDLTGSEKRLESLRILTVQGVRVSVKSSTPFVLGALANLFEVKADLQLWHPLAQIETLRHSLLEFNDVDVTED